jgi:hypothetical protein
MSGQEAIPIVKIVKKGVENGEDNVLDLADYEPEIKIEDKTVFIRFKNPGNKWLLFFHPYFFETMGYTTVHTYLLTEKVVGGRIMSDEMEGGSGENKSSGLPLPFSLFFRLFHVFHLFSFSWKYRPPKSTPTYKMATDGNAGKLPLYQKYLEQGDTEKKEAEKGSLFSNILAKLNFGTSDDQTTSTENQEETINSEFWEIRLSKEEYDHIQENERIQREITIRKKYKSPVILLPRIKTN